MARTFTSKPARREAVPLLIGLVGPSGSGKTFSALRLASGIRRATGCGHIQLIDTESRRGLHYADDFQYQHQEFDAPFGSLDYLAAVQHAVGDGAGVVIVDSMSHEHEGPGGMLESHQAEVERLSGGDARKADRVKMLAWARPKADRRRMINSILQLRAHVIFCFRAEEKIDMDAVSKREDKTSLGYMPIAPMKFLYEMTLCCLLPPGADGVPDWQPEGKGAQKVIKLPKDFRSVLPPGAQLTEAVGAELAQWAAGGREATADDLKSALQAISASADATALRKAAQSARQFRLTAEQRDALTDAYTARKEAIENPPREPGED